MTERELIHAALLNLTEAQLRDLQITAARFKRLPFSRLTEVALAKEAWRKEEISQRELRELEEQALIENQSRNESTFLRFLDEEIARLLGAPGDRASRVSRA